MNSEEYNEAPHGQFKPGKGHTPDGVATLLGRGVEMKGCYANAGNCAGMELQTPRFSKTHPKL